MLAPLPNHINLAVFMWFLKWFVFVHCGSLLIASIFHWIPNNRFSSSSQDPAYMKRWRKLRIITWNTIYVLAWQRALDWMVLSTSQQMLTHSCRIFTSVQFAEGVNQPLIKLAKPFCGPTLNIPITSWVEWNALVWTGLELRIGTIGWS